MSLSEEITDKHHARETLQMVQRALRQGWELPENIRASLPQLVSGWLTSDGVDERTRMRAAELLADMHKSNLAHLVELAKQVRLDTPGESTEKQTIRVVFDDD